MKNKLSSIAFGLFILIFAFKNNAMDQSPSNSIKIAYSEEISNIRIDGKINDWPNSSEKYSIENPLWGKPKGRPSDFSAYFMIGHNLEENCLYMAVVVHDDIDIIDNEEPDLQEIDSYSLFVDEKHDLKGSGIARYSISENGKELGSFADNWDPDLAKYLKWEKIDYSIGKEKSNKIYEFKFTLEKPIYHKRII